MLSKKLSSDGWVQLLCLQTLFKIDLSPLSPQKQTLYTKLTANGIRVVATS
jgi:hypothetical protein